jgi:hypothetical protein
MITPHHYAVAARANRTGLPISPAGVAEIERLLREEIPHHAGASTL